MTIDRIDAHWDDATDAVSDAEHWERAGAHIGYYIEWAFRKGLANPETHGNIEDIQNIFNSNVNGLQYLIEYCDAKFWDDDLNEEGKRFTTYAYDEYFENFEKIVGHKLYTKNYNQQDLEAVSKYLDKVYEDYLTNQPSNQIKEENRTPVENEIIERCNFLIKGLTIVDIFVIIMFCASFGIETAAIIAFGILGVALTLSIVLLKKAKKDPLKYKKYFYSSKNDDKASSKNAQFNNKIEYKNARIITNNEKQKIINSTNTDVKVNLDNKNGEVDEYETSDEEYNKFHRECIEKLEKVANSVKKHTARDSYSIELLKEKTSLFDSKLGGIPYWDLSRKYPVDKNGNKLILLAQINLENENFESDKLPNTGMLQFFVENEFNCSFKENNKVIYHEKIDKSITEDDIRKLNIPTSLDSEIDITIKDEYKLSFKKVKDTISIHDYRFYDVLEKVYNKLYETNDFHAFKNELEFEDVMYDKFSDGEGHKLLGFPHFCQEDPRSAIKYNSSRSDVKLSTSINENGNKTMSWFPSASDVNKIKEENEKQKEFPSYNTLLLQIDSCDEFTWGDGGQINIFINSKDLKNLDFDKVLWNFDCY